MNQVEFQEKSRQRNQPEFQADNHFIFLLAYPLLSLLRCLEDVLQPNRQSSQESIRPINLSCTLQGSLRCSQYVSLQLFQLDRVQPSRRCSHRLSQRFNPARSHRGFLQYFQLASQQMNHRIHPQFYRVVNRVHNQ